jgi:hypothetical protein
MANGTLKVSNIQTSSGSGTITLGQSGETVTIPSGCTITNSGTQTGFGEACTPIAILIGNGSDQTVSGSAFTTLTFWSAETDSDSMYGSNKITIPSGKGGKYFVSVRVQLNSTTDINEVALRIRTANNATNFMYTQRRHTYNDFITLTGSRNLSAGDNLTLDIYHSDGSSKAIDGDAYKANWTIFRIAS